MKYININKLAGASEKSFLKISPYPWLNLHELVTPEGFDELLGSLPDVSMFEKSFNLERSHGQKPHDRYELRYSDSLILSPAWKSFIEELSSAEYGAELKRLFGVKNFNIRFQWQYSFNGCSVSPHCDSRNKIGSQIFYLNTSDNWKEEWGGQTLVLDDGGKLNCDSAPDITQFHNKIAVRTLGNYSLLFARTDHSWHSVGALQSPPDVLRKIFTVIIERKPTLLNKIVVKIKSLFS